MNAVAILALIADLYQQIVNLEEEKKTLLARIAELEAS